MNRIKRLVKIATNLVNLVHETNARNPIFGRLAPNRFRLRLNTHLTVKHHYCTIQHTKRALHLSRKVDVTRGIDNVNLVVLPVNRHGRGSNRNPAFLFLLHPVGLSTTRAALHEVNFMFKPGAIQNRLGSRGFTCINVRNNTNIAKLV